MTEPVTSPVLKKAGYQFAAGSDGGGYHVSGKRGAFWLERTSPRPHLMFVARLDGGARFGELCGYGWWRDDGGVLRPAKSVCGASGGRRRRNRAD
jgi:hypothetical protein